MTRAEAKTEPAGPAGARDIRALEEYLAGIRRRWRAWGSAAGAATLAFGLVSVALVWTVPEMTVSPVFLMPAALAAPLTVLAGVLVLFHVAFIAPGAARMADLVERSRPGLRDSLATALERGPYAPASAAYAAGRIDPKPRLRGLAMKSLVVWPALVAGSVLVLAGSVAVRGLSSRAGEEGTVPLRSSKGLSLFPPPARAIDGAEPSEGTGAGDPAEGAADRVPEAPAAGLVIRAVEPARAAPSTGRAATAADVLLSAPEGFERAVELFVTGTPFTAEGARDAGKGGE